jgi:hypothetical protein
VSSPVPSGPPAADEALLERQAALQAEASALLAELTGALGPLAPTGSYVSGLMAWRDLDVMRLVGPDFSGHDVLGLLARLLDLPGVVAYTCRDERGHRSPTGERRDERYHVPVTLARGDAEWRVDLSLWLHDDHATVTAWHEALRDRVTDEQRRAVLRIKDVWHRLPTYPDEVGGVEIYSAVLEAGVRTPAEFAAWLEARRALS